MNSLGFELHIAGEQTIEALHTGESGICSSHVIFWPRKQFERVQLAARSEFLPAELASRG